MNELSIQKKSFCEINQRKNLLRKKLLRRFKVLASEQVEQVSAAICERLDPLITRSKVTHLGLYRSIQNEVDLYNFACLAKIREIKIYYPRFNEKFRTYEMAIVNDLDSDFSPGYLGILEPKGKKPKAECEIVLYRMTWLVPGLGFNHKGYRLGRGKGYYDRLLEKTHGCKIGIAYDWQVVKDIPVEKDDISMDYVVTASQTLVCSG